MTYTAADVANNGGVAWVRSMAASMDPKAIDSQIQGYAAAQSVLQNAAASTTAGQNKLLQAWQGAAAQAAQEKFTTTANLHTATADTIQQVMIGLSYTSSGMGSFIQTVLGPNHQPGNVPDPSQGIPMEKPVPLLTDQQVNALTSPPLTGSTTAFNPFQAHQDAVTQNLKVRQQAADALNELASSYSTAQTYFTAVAQPQIDTGPQVNNTAFNLGPTPTNSPKKTGSVHVPAVHGSSSAGSSAPISTPGSGGIALSGGGTTSLQGGAPTLSFPPPTAPTVPTAPVIGGNPSGIVPGGGSGTAIGNPSVGVFTGDSDGAGNTPIPPKGGFEDTIRSGATSRGLGTGSGISDGTVTVKPFDGAPGFGQAGTGSSSSSETSETPGVLTDDGSRGTSSGMPMMGGMGGGMGRASGGDSGDGESGRRSSRLTRGQFFDTEEEDWQLPQPSSVYEGATDQDGNPIEAYQTGWQRIREATQKANNNRSELEGPW
ncbi:MAG TPA: hypothetical protein VGX23_12375 [Actinocrinis sp.]|nr:hypothetical protein [Actinocrinis sp.]